MAKSLDSPPASSAESGFRRLSLAESHAFLDRNHVGRVAFSLHDRVDIQPINYVSEGDWIFGRTSEGTKLSTLLHHPWCAFEVDEVRGLYDWTSVVVKGAFSVLDPKIGSLHTYQRAQALLKRLVPPSAPGGDPASHRNVVFGIFAPEVSGRATGS